MAKAKKVEVEEPLEKKLWKAADKLRKNMDAAEYKHVALGLIFLKYISDAFEELHTKLVSQKSDGADPEDKNEYVAEKVFYLFISSFSLSNSSTVEANSFELLSGLSLLKSSKHSLLLIDETIPASIFLIF